MDQLTEAIHTFREKNNAMPFALYVDPITMVATDFRELEILGIPVKVSTACAIGDYYLVSEDEAKELEEWNAKQGAR